MKKPILLSLALSLVHCSGTAAGNTSSGGTGSTSSGGSGGSSVSSSNGTSGGSSSGGSSATNGGSSSSGQGASSSGAGSSGAGSSGDLTYHGAVFLTASTFPAPVGSTHLIAAGFVDQNSPIPNDPGDCTGGTQVDAGSGVCCYRSGPATTTADGGSTGTSSAEYSAGPITITDSPPTGSSATLGMLTPSATGAYSFLTAATWAQGDGLTVSAPGATIPAFSGTATAPPAVTITQPTVSGLTASVSTSSALVVNWDGTGGSKVYTILYTVQLTSGPSVTCTTPDEGHATIPSSMLSHFSAGSYGALLVGRVISQDASVPNAEITLYVTTGNGIAVSYTQ